MSAPVETKTLILNATLNPTDSHVPSLDRALDLLETVARSSRGLTLSELVRVLQIPKSSMHYLIETLTSRGYLARDSTGRGYVIGLRIMNLVNTRIIVAQLTAKCAHYTREIAQKLGMTTAASVLDGSEGLILCADTPAGSTHKLWPGQHFNLHCTGMGKALMASMSDAELERLFCDRSFARYSANTLPSWLALREEISQVRATGYALNNGELEAGVRCVSAPILDHRNRSIAAFSVGAPKHEIPLWQMAKLGREIASVARGISRDFASRVCSA